MRATIPPRRRALQAARQLLLNGSNFTVIGVLPAGFDGLQLGPVRDLYVPMMMQAIMRPPRAVYSGEMNPDLLQVRGPLAKMKGVAKVDGEIVAEAEMGAMVRDR